MDEPAAPRLLLLVQLPPPIHGAALINQHVVNSELISNLFDVRVIPLRFASSIEDIGSVSPGKLMRALGAAFRIGRALTTTRPDIVYLTLSLGGGAFLRDCVFVAIIKAAGVPHVFHLHGKGIARNARIGWRRALYRWAFREAYVIQLSRLLANDLTDVVRTEQVHFVANGVPRRTQGRDREQVVGAARILFLSNMIESKGPLVLLDALSMLDDRDIAFTATFAGAPHHPECLLEFERRVVRYGLEGRVRYVGPSYGSTKLELLMSHDIFVLPTQEDAFPLVLLEAMEAALPILSTEEGAIPEIVENGRTGVLVKPGDAGAVADELADLIADADLRARLGEQGRTRYLERYTLQHFERNLAETLTRCLSLATSK